MRTPQPMPNRRRGLRRLMPLVLPLMLLPLAGCQTLSIGTRYLDTSCLALRPITYSSKSDSAATIKQIREHNAAYTALCPATKPGG